VGGARDGNLTGRTFHELAARKLFDKIVVDRARTHQLDAMFQARPRSLKLGKLVPLDAKPVLHVGKRKRSALTPDGVVAEVGDYGAGNRRQHGNAKKACHATSDSHAMNESRTDSVGQAEIAE
jgi:hypothetical protein